MQDISTVNTQPTEFPIVLVHGIMLKDFKFFRAFGRIEKRLRALGYKVYTAKIDGFGTIENNAEQLLDHVNKILDRENTHKVNIIAHSKGGLDSVYMINELGMSEHVASLTTLCTPHKGSPIASWLLKLPKIIKKFIAFWINLFYRIFGDKHPDALKVCEQLSLHNGAIVTEMPNVYCQSYSATLKKSRNDFIMGIPLMFSHKLEHIPSDGLVSAESSKFGNYRGDLTDVSHTQIVDFMVSKRKRERIYGFYSQLCGDLAEMGF